MDALFAAMGLADASLFVRAVIAFLICLALLALVFLLIGWLSGRSPLPSSRSGGRQPRLGVVEETGIDGKRRLILVRRDNAEHLILTGGPNDLVIEGPILRGAAKPRADGVPATEAQRRAQARAAAARRAAGEGQPTPPRPEPAKAEGPVTPAPRTPQDKAQNKPQDASLPPAAPVPEAVGEDPFAKARTRPQADLGTAAVAAGAALAAAPNEPAAPASPSPAAPDEREREDAALADAFARDLEADLGADPLEADLEARVEADLLADTTTPSPVAEPVVPRPEPAQDLHREETPFPTGAIPTPTSSQPPSQPPSPAPSPETAPDAIDAITGPRRRGQVPLDDEPAPELPRFLRGGRGEDARRTPETAAEAPETAPEPAAPTQLSPRAILGFPSETAPVPEAPEPERAPEDDRPAFPGPEAEPIADTPAEPPTPEAPAAEEAPGPAPVARPFDALYRAREGAPRPLEPSESPSGDDARSDNDEAPAAPPPGASDMRSLEQQMESLLRELTTRGKPDGEKT